MLDILQMFWTRHHFKNTIFFQEECTFNFLMALWMYYYLIFCLYKNAVNITTFRNQKLCQWDLGFCKDGNDRHISYFPMVL